MLLESSLWCTLSEKKYVEEVINKDEVQLALVGRQLAPEQKNMLAGRQGFLDLEACVCSGKY